MTPGEKRHTVLKLRKAVVEWLQGQPVLPNGVAFDMQTRASGERVDVFAVTLRGRSRDLSGLLGESSLFICCPTKEDCSRECANPEAIEYALSSLRIKQSELEARIRKMEPELRDAESLFEELAIWKYEQSSDKEYHTLKSAVGTMEELLYKGTRMAHLTLRPLADKMYLVTPKGIIAPELLLDGWGLLEVTEEGVAELVKPPVRQNTDAETKAYVIKRMMESNFSKVLNTLNRKWQKSSRQQNKQATKDSDL